MSLKVTLIFLIRALCYPDRPLPKRLRALVYKNQTYRGKGGKFDFFLILMLDRLGYN